MRVALNLVFMVPGETGGMETYARRLIPALRAVAPSLHLIAFTNREAAGDDVGANEQVTVPVRAANRLQWVRGEQQLLPVLARRAGCHVMHSLASTSPVWGAFKRVTTIHDLNYLVVPEAHFGMRALGMRALVPLAARRSHRVIAISSSTRNDLVTRLRVPEARIHVVPQGVAVNKVAPTPESELRARLSLGRRPVLLSLSAKRPHKNLRGLLEALARISEDRRPIAVLPGYPTPHEAELRAHARALGVDADVRWLGWTPEEDVEGLFSLAAAFVFPSFYEGFGLPVLEAMVRGVPVACSNRASLPEVAGDAALLFDADDPGSIAGAIERLVWDGELAAALASAGRARAATFTWEETARRTLTVYDRAIRGS